MSCDFFHVATVLLRVLYVLVFIHRDPPLVRVAGMTPTPATDRVTRQAPNSSMDLADQLAAVTILVHHRDTNCTASFDAVFTGDKTTTIKTPDHATAIGTRVTGPLRRE